SSTSASEHGRGQMSTTTTYAEVVEGIRATIAAYTQALDDGRTDDVVATFCPDGVSEVAGMGTYEGHDALREAYAGWKPRRPQRHLVLNTLVTDWNDHEAEAISDVVFVMARFSNPEVGEKVEAIGVSCIRHDLFEPFADLPDDFDYVFHSALPLARGDVPSMGRWPNSFDAYADATGRLMAHCRPAKGF